MNILPRDGVTAREIGYEVAQRVKRQRVSMAVGIHDDGRVQISPACEIEGERLIASDAYVWTCDEETFNDVDRRAELIEALRDRIFAVLGTRMRLAE